MWTASGHWWFDGDGDGDGSHVAYVSDSSFSKVSLLGMNETREIWKVNVNDGKLIALEVWTHEEDDATDPKSVFVATLSMNATIRVWSDAKEIAKIPSKFYEDETLKKKTSISFSHGYPYMLRKLGKQFFVLADQGVFVVRNVPI